MKVVVFEGALRFAGMASDYRTVPRAQDGLLYRVGARCEAGGTGLVLDEIHRYGREGRIFEVHFRNVRGNLATAGGFKEAPSTMET